MSPLQDSRAVAHGDCLHSSDLPPPTPRAAVGNWAPPVMHTPPHTLSQVHTQTHICTHTCAHKDAYSHVHACAHSHMHIHMCASSPVHTYAHECVPTQCTLTCACLCTLSHSYTSTDSAHLCAVHTPALCGACPRAYSRTFLGICMHVHTHTCTRAHTDAYIYLGL